MTHINSLPTEIIQIVFLLVIESAFQNDTNLALSRTILCLTHVCTAWRSLGLAFPQMWFPILFNPKKGAKLANLFLKRGRPAHLRLRAVKNEGFRVCTQLGGHVKRLEEVEIVIACVRCTQLFEQLAKGKELPDLVFLDVRINDHVPRATKPTLAVGTPGVRHLGLNDIQLKSLASFTDLTYLRLENVGGSIKVKDLIALFSRSPRLQVLQLGHIQEILKDGITQQDPIHFPELQTLSLRQMDENLLPLCSLLLPSAGSTTHTHISEREIEDFEPLFEVASQTMWLFTTPHELSIQMYNRRKPPGYVMHIHPFSEPESHASLKLFLPYDTFVNLGSQHLDLSRVTSLSVEVKYISAISSFPHLRRLAIENNQRSVDKKQLEHHLSSKSTEMVCPGLQLMRVAFSGGGREADVVPWVDVARARVLNGCGRLRCLELYVPGPQAQIPLDIPFEEFAQEVVVKPYSYANWPEWNFVDES